MPKLPLITALLLFTTSALPIMAEVGKEKETRGGPFGKAPIEGIEKSGHYRLSVLPELHKYCMSDLRDLRIIRKKGGEKVEVPYILEEKDAFDPFIEKRRLKVLERKSLKEGGTVVEVEDELGGKIPALALEVDQGTVSRTIRITASDDVEKEGEWEQVYAGQRYHDERYPDGTRRFVLRGVDLDPHRFYRIHVGAEGRGLDPRILEVQVIRVENGWESYHKVPTKGYERITKKERTYIRPVFDAPSFRIDGFELELGEPDYFYRSGFLARGDPEEPDSLKKLTAFDMVSYGEGELHFDGYPSRDLLIVLKDGDLPPLSIEGVKAYQRERSLLFQANEKGDLFLEFGERDAEVPDYELPHFREQMSARPMSASFGEIRWNGPALSKWVKEEKRSDANKAYRILNTVGIILIWLFGVAVLVSIGILIYRRAL